MLSINVQSEAALKTFPHARTGAALPGGPPGPILEMGPQILLPDGRVFAIGASGHTALYTPPIVPTNPGTWTAGPDFPADMKAALAFSGASLDFTASASAKEREWVRLVEQTNSR